MKRNLYSIYTLGLILTLIFLQTGIASGQSIVRQPENVTECEGIATVTFKVGVLRGFIGTFQWVMAPYKTTDFRPVSAVYEGVDDTQATLTLEYNKLKGGLGLLTTAMHRTQFVCIVTPDGKVPVPEASDVAYLFVLTSPYITKHPSAAEKNAGESVSFSVTAGGSPTLSYQWQKDAVNVSGATSSVYTIPSVTKDDEGTYRCIVTNSCGSRTSTGAVLTVNEPIYEEGWFEQESNTSKDIRQVSFTTDRNGWAVVYDLDKLLHTTDGGETWSVTSTGLGSYYWYSVHFNNTSAGFLGGSSGNIARTENGGSSWERYYYRDSLDITSWPVVYDFFFLDANTGWAVGSEGIVLKTEDGGDNWGLQNHNGVPNSGLDPVLFGVWFANPDTGWVAGENGKIFYTKDGGTVWTVQETPNTTNLSDITFLDENKGFAVGYGYRNVLVTANGGEDWGMIPPSNMPIMVPNSIFFTNSNDGWISGYMYDGSPKADILRTNDGGTTWHRQYVEEGGDQLKHLVMVDSENGWAVGNTGTIRRTASGGCLNPEVNLYGDEALCASEGYTMVADTFTKNLNCSYLWSTGANLGHLFVTESGEYSVTVTNLCGITAEDSKNLEFYPSPDADAGDDLNLCNGDTVQLNVTGGALYSWSPTSTLSDPNIQNPRAFPNMTTEYLVTVTDTNGCVDMDQITVIVPSPYEGTEICLVTVDPETGKNLVVWEKAEDQGIESYNIYREGTQTGVYNFLVNIPFDSLSVYTDVTSQPRNKQHLYKIAAVDTCGNESSRSAYHKTLLLQYVSAEGGVNLSWSEYEIEDGAINFVSYIIYRGSDSTALTIIDTISASSDVYTDTDPEALESKRWYRIAGIKPVACYPTVKVDGRKAGTGPYAHSLSNMDDNKLRTSSINDVMNGAGNLSIYPNPFRDKLRVEYAVRQASDVKIEVYNILGIRVLEIENGRQLPGRYSYDIRAVDLHGSSLYYLKFTMDNKTSVRKLIPAK